MLRCDKRCVPGARSSVMVGLLAAVLIGLTSGGGVASSPGAAGDTYRWDAELVALAADTSSVVVSARVVSATAVADLEGVAVGDPIVVVWSGYGDRAVGIRQVRRGPVTEGPERFALAATYVASDPTRRRLTFAVTPPTESVATLRRLTRGAWVTVTSRQAPPTPRQAVVALAGFAQTPSATSPPVGADATYQWSAELVALDAATRALTVRARAVTEAAVRSVAALAPGDPMVITWSGADDRAHGIRAVANDDGLWGGDRFLLPATFEQVEGHLVTFTVTAPTASVADIRRRARGEWATLTSPHRPATAAAAVTAFATYGPAPRTGPRPTGSYQWHAELVALDEAAPALTVSARLVTRESQAAAAAFTAGDRMVVTWSGARGQADGIRQVRAFDDSGLWGGDRFLLPATFERVDGQVLTFTVPAPAASVADIRQHSRGDWATLTSPHRPATAAEAVTAVRDVWPGGADCVRGRPARISGMRSWWRSTRRRRR